jgi:cytochrome c-type biogenesis protein CcmE
VTDRDGSDILDADDYELDLTPRPAEDVPRAPRKKGRRWGAIVVLVLVVAAGGYILSQALGSAATYYYNADEAVAKKASIGDKDFRIQGTVTKATKQGADGTSNFTIAFNGVHVNVVHSGDTPALFKVGIPVVTHGHWEGDTFRSDQIEVKHSATYREKNPDRVKSDQP